MGTPRLKGQECAIQVIQGGTIVNAFNAMASFNDNQKSAKIEQGYIGETTNRHDDIYNGFDGGFEFHMESADWANFSAAMIARQRRFQPELVFNVLRTDFLPNGQQFTRTYLDVKFGPLPTNISDRGSYVSGSIDFSCDEIDDDQTAII